METIVQTTSRKDDKVSRVIDKILNQVFGQEATQMIYKYLDHNYSLKRNEISERIDVFAQGLEDFLRSGAYAIERKILQDVYSSYDMLRRSESEKRIDEGDFVSQMKLLMRRA